MVETRMAEDDMIEFLYRFGRLMFRGDRLWGYYKYINACVAWGTFIVVTGWPWYIWVGGFSLLTVLAVYIMVLDKKYIYRGYSAAQFEHLKELKRD